ncbi:hypothetical protein LCGC14_3146150 [marine sediment metagenome]|uniref:Uncharacterized protein n=1 Tax=marine sediment metagenome TaxID=412755 RepID=A0A0F8Y288_9ZZZZ
MPRVTITPSQLIVGGVAFSPVAVETDGNAFPNTGNQLFYIKNSNAGTIVVTIQTPLTIEGIAVAEITKSILTTEEFVFGTFSTHIFNQSNGEVWIDYDVATSVTIQVFTQ